jgi:diaminopimelate decarboxylase
VITDAGMNDLIRPSLYQAHHEIVPVVLEDSRGLEVSDIVGPVCESGDFFAHDREMAEVKAGELVALLDAGAYGMSLGSNYNSRGRAAEVLVRAGVARLVKRRETVEDLMVGEIL